MEKRHRERQRGRERRKEGGGRERERGRDGEDHTRIIIIPQKLVTILECLQ